MIRGDISAIFWGLQGDMQPASVKIQTHLLCPSTTSGQSQSKSEQFQPFKRWKKTPKWKPLGFDCEGWKTYHVSYCESITLRLVLANTTMSALLNSILGEMYKWFGSWKLRYSGACLGQALLKAWMTNAQIVGGHLVARALWTSSMLMSLLVDHASLSDTMCGKESNPGCSNQDSNPGCVAVV